MKYQSDDKTLRSSLRGCCCDRDLINSRNESAVLPPQLPEQSHYNNNAAITPAAAPKPAAAVLTALFPDCVDEALALACEADPEEVMVAMPLLADADADSVLFCFAACALAFCWLMKFAQFRGVPFWSMMMIALLPKKDLEDLSVER